MVTQNRFSGGARDRFFGGAGEGFLAILGFKRFFWSNFGVSGKFFGRVLDFSVGPLVFRSVSRLFLSVFRYSGRVLGFSVGFLGILVGFRFSGRPLEFLPRVVNVTGKYHS